MLVEVDVLTAAAEALAALGFDDFTFRLNDRALLAALTDTAGITPDRSALALVSLDKLDKIGPDGVRDELVEKHGFEREQAERLFSLLEAGSPASGGLRGLTSALGDAAPTVAISRLESIFGALDALGFGARGTFDPALARGLSYYTGPIYEIALPGFSGSVGAGGRYDNLVGMFLGRAIPACGVSLGVERLIMIMEERGLFPEGISSRCDVYVTQFPGVDPTPGLQLAAAGRAQGLRVDVSPNATKLKKQFKLAEAMNAKLVVVIGPDEAAAGQVVLKTMSTGEQRKVGGGGGGGGRRGALPAGRRVAAPCRRPAPHGG